VLCVFQVLHFELIKVVIPRLQVDDKLRKRLVKNRLSAERSRQRKQAHVETLEFELSCCRSENEHLRQRVASLEAQLAAFSLGNTPKASFCPQIALAVHA
jgi:BMFP domain-containing protein YqiC